MEIVIFFFALASSILQFGGMVTVVVNAIGQSKVIDATHQIVWTLITSGLWSVFYLIC